MDNRAHVPITKGLKEAADAISGPAIERARKEARNAALEEAARWYEEKGWLLDESLVAAAIRALKDGEG